VRPLLVFVSHSPLLVWGPLLVITVLFFGLMAVFGVLVARDGLPHHPRVKNLGNAVMGQFFLEYFYWLQKPVGPIAVKLRISPDAVSWTSLVLQLLGAVALGSGAFAMGGWLLFLGAACDALDGTVARARDLASDAGEVLDAVIDRWAEMATCFGFAWYYRDDLLGFVLSVWACAASVMVSYTRAKGETLDLDAKMGVMNRHERAAYLISATIINAWIQLRWPESGHPRFYLVLVALGLIAGLGTVTAIRRTAFMRRELRKR
jgi:phosphatidylglycerophosphate synthase